MKKPILDEAALRERASRKEHLLDVRPKTKPNSKMWTVVSILLFLILLAGSGFMFARACSPTMLAGFGEEKEEISAGLRE